MVLYDLVSKCIIQIRFHDGRFLVWGSVYIKHFGIKFASAMFELRVFNECPVCISLRFTHTRRTFFSIIDSVIAVYVSVHLKYMHTRI